MEKIFEKLGLTQQQARIYLNLLQEVSPAGEIAKKLDINRVSCYDSLNRLQKKGLVTYAIRGGKKYFEAVDPQGLLKLAEEKVEKSKEEEKDVKKIFPYLQRLREKKGKSKQEANIYKGKDGIKTLFTLMLASREILVLSATGKALKELKYFFPQWHKKREKKGSIAKIIFNSEMRGDRVTRIPLSEVRFLPKEYSSPATLFIFGDFVATLIWEEIPLAILVESEQIAKSYKNYFKLIWKIAK